MTSPTTRKARPAQRPLRILTYSHDSVGLGHLRRSVTMAGALLAAGSNAHALCLTGSPVPDLFPLPPSCDLVKLPSIGKSSTGAYVARRLPISAHAISRLRSDVITATVRSFHPDLLLVDHTASGPRDELLPVLRRLSHERLATRVVLGMRDVLDEPVLARREFARNRTFDVIRNYYDRVMIYGDRAVFDPTIEYEFPEDIAAKTVFTGPVVAPEAHQAWQPRSVSRPARLVVTAGGGEDGYDLLRGAIAALRGPLRSADLEATIVAGPLSAVDAYTSLERAVDRDPRLTLTRSTSQMQVLLGQADLVVGMGGYNTVYECLARRIPFLAVPRTKPRLEQWERCRRLSRCGALRLLSSDAALEPHRLAAAIREELRGQRAQPTSIECRGAETAARFCMDLVARGAQSDSSLATASP